MTRRLLRFALLADGPSDCALLPIVSWVLLGHQPELELAKPGFRARTRRQPLQHEMRETVEFFRPDLLFVHRDAEAQDPDQRHAEIPAFEHPMVKVVPVRMTEAWLLFDEPSIRGAADNPAGRAPVDLPTLQRVEQLPDPKQRLRDALLAAADLTGRRRKRFVQSLGARSQRVAELIDDFAPLRRLQAFQRFEQDCAAALRALSSS
jgi:hypothetical protein